MKKKLFLVNLSALLIFLVQLPFSFFYLVGFWYKNPIVNEQVMVIILYLLYFGVWVLLNICVIKRIRLTDMTRSILINLRRKSMKTRVSLSIILIVLTLWILLHCIPIYSVEGLSNYTSDDWRDMILAEKYMVSLSLYNYAKCYDSDEYGNSGRLQFAHDYIELIDDSNSTFSNLYYYVMSSISGYGA